MPTIAQKLASILEYKGDIKDAIESKGVSVGDAPLSNYADKINQIYTSEEYDDIAPWNDVRFIDYDGKCILSYSAEDFLALSAMPSYPMTHSGLSFVEWNWSFAIAQKYVYKYGCLLVGATLTSSDGATRLTLNIQDDELLTVPLAFKQSKTYGTLIDWGDGSTAERFSGTDFTAYQNYRWHTYPRKGRYTITYTPDVDCNLSPTTGTYGSPFGYYYGGPNMLYSFCVESIIYGRVLSTGTNLWCNGINIKTVVPPSQMYGQYGSQGFSVQIPGLVIPKFNKDIVAGACDYFLQARDISLPENSLILNNNAFRYCEKIKMMTPPETTTTINQTVFAWDFKLKRVVIPESVTSIGNNAFQLCISIEELIIPDSVTTLGTTGAMFNSDYKLKKLKISNNITSLPASFAAYCFSLEEIIIPEGVITIGNSAFASCLSAKKIVVPSTVTTLGNDVFRCNYNSMYQKLENFYIKAPTPPTIGTNLFQNTSVPDFTIYVPKGSLSAYQSATNWSTYSARMQEYDFTRVEAEFNVTSTSTPTRIIGLNAVGLFSGVEIDGTAITPAETYTFSTAGKHTIKYTLVDTTKIGANAFYQCSQMTDVYIPPNIAVIDGYSFNSTGLTKVTIPKNVTSILYQAFDSCSNLITVIMESTTPATVNNFPFSGNNNLKVYTLASCLNSYKTATNWSSGASQIVEMRYWDI